MRVTRKQETAEAREYDGNNTVEFAKWCGGIWLNEHVGVKLVTRNYATHILLPGYYVIKYADGCDLVKSKELFEEQYDIL